MRRSLWSLQLLFAHSAFQTQNLQGTPVFWGVVKKVKLPWLIDQFLRPIRCPCQLSVMDRLSNRAWRFWRAILRCKTSASEFRLKSRARRRAERWYKCRVAASGLKTAKSDHLAELSALAGSGARLVGPVTQHQGDELSAALHVDAPWFADVTTHIMVQLRRQISEGKVGMRLHPILLVGPFGNGKSKYARNLAALVNAPSHEIDVGSGSAGFRISGVERGWGSATPGVPVETIFKSGVANPFMIVNEIEKAGEMRSERVGGTTSIAVSL